MTTSPPNPTPEEPEKKRQALRDSFEKAGKVAGNDFGLSISAGATNMATIEVTLFRGGACYTERGLVRSQSSHVEISPRIGDGGNRLYRWGGPGFWKRLMMKEGFWTAEFNNKSANTAAVEITPSQYSGLFAINLDNKKDGSITASGERVRGIDKYESIYCPRGSWMMSGPSNRTTFNFFSNLFKPAAWLGRLPFLMEKITGNDVVILGGSMPLKHIDIPAGDHHIVDHREVFGFTEMEHSLHFSPKRKLSGENFASLRFDGPGKLILKHR